MYEHKPKMINDTQDMIKFIEGIPAEAFCVAAVNNGQEGVHDAHDFNVTRRKLGVRTDGLACKMRLLDWLDKMVEEEKSR